jgi:ribosome-binding ATPase
VDAASDMETIDTEPIRELGLLTPKPFIYVFNIDEAVLQDAPALASTGQDESGLDKLARIGFDTLGVQTYLTAGLRESRAWTIGKGWKAPQAAGVIHTDFEKGFIKAEVIGFADLVETGSIAEARAKGKARIEGKDYVMQDGDVVEFRHS